MTPRGYLGDDLNTPERLATPATRPATPATLDGQTPEWAAPPPGWPVPDARHAWTGVGLRDMSRAERGLRLALALLALALGTVAALAATAGPRRIRDDDAVLRDAAAGRVTRIDVNRLGGYVRWQTRAGHRYQSGLPFVFDANDDGRAIRNAVRAQPYVAAHPASVTFERIGPPHVPFTVVAADLALWLAAVVLLVRGPQPRWLTKWGWFWAIGLPPLLAAYLVSGGSWRRGGLGRPRRPTGAVTVWVLLMLVRVATGAAGNAITTWRNPHPARGSFVSVAPWPPPPA
jgi:hypothetical protein